LGQASKRGSFKQRKALAIQREQDRLATIEEKRQLRHQQECDAYSIMVWWQIDMSEDRHARIIRAKQKSQMEWASLMGMICGMGWDSFSRRYR